MNTIKDSGVFGATDEFIRNYVVELEKETSPYRIMLTKVDVYDIYQVFFKRFPPKGTWFKLDEIGNVWISSKTEGANYDSIPYSTVLELIKEKAKNRIENPIDLIPIQPQPWKSELSHKWTHPSPFFYLVTMPVNDDVARAILDEERTLSEPVTRLTASRNKQELEHTGIGLFGDYHEGNYD